MKILKIGKGGIEVIYNKPLKVRLTKRQKELASLLLNELWKKFHPPIRVINNNVFKSKKVKEKRMTFLNER